MSDSEMSASKAIAGGVTTAVIGFIAHYGFTLSPVVHDAVSSIALALASYVVGHLVVFWTTNKPKV